jgi:hypothetical protein
MPMEYRRDINGLWHFSDCCPRWPENSFNIIRSEKLPPDFDLCEICKTLSKTDDPNNPRS